MALATDGRLRKYSWGWIGFFVNLESVQVIRPRLHHLSPLWQVSRAVVGPPERIAHHVCQLVFDVVGSKAQHFIQKSSCHGTEAVPAHLLLADAQAAQCGKDGVLAHWPVSPWRTTAREDIASLSGQRVEFAQDLHCLPGKGHQMLGIGLGDAEAPFGRFQVDIGPFGSAELTGPDENQWSQPKGTAHNQ